MPINLHFFRNSDLEKIDFTKVFEFFDSYPNFKIFYTEEDVQIVYRDDDFKFSYRYLITKKSRVKEIYKLNPMYLNVNFLLELPVMIPTFLAKEILAITLKICKLFDLEIYHDTFEDVQQFNSVDVLILFEKMREQYIEEYGLNDKIMYPHEKLNEICKFQRSVESLRDYYQHEVEVNLCQPIIEANTNEFGISSVWNVGKPTVFPPHIDYYYIHDEQNIIFLVNRKDFYSLMNKYLVEVETILPDMFILKQKQAKASKKIVNKLKKCAIVDKNFKNVRLCDMIDEKI